MRDVFYLARRYLAHHRGKTAILVASIALIAYVPVGLNVLVSKSAARLTARAVATPLLLGAPGSPLELILNSLYFETESPEAIGLDASQRVGATGLAEAIPLHVRFQVREYPIVGTVLEYFDFRSLHTAEGRLFAVLGECVLGASAARELGVSPGDAVVSSPTGVFDLAGSYPLRLQVVGVLEASDGPDDRAVFVDVKTAWVIEGLGHGHRDLSEPGAASAVLEREGEAVTANASVVEYNEVTDENAASFHFHGDLAGYPITAVIAVPNDEKSRVLLMGRFAGADQPLQLARPSAVMAELLETVASVERYAIAAILLVSGATAATATLVFLLSLRLRRREIATLVKLGGSRGRVAAVLLSEVALVTAAGIAIAAVLTLLTSRFGESAIRAFVLT